MLAKSGRVNPLASAPAVASLLTGACCDSGEINRESSIWTWESDSTQASVDISRTEIWEEISETNWRQCSIAERLLLLPNFILNLLLSFCGERKRVMLEPDKFYIITQKNTVKTRLLLHAVGPASSSGASFFARQRRARNEWLVMNRKEPWEGYRRQVKPVVSFPPSVARTFSSKERRLGTRQLLGKVWNWSNFWANDS